MSDRKTYHITSKDDHWQVKARGAQRATRLFDTKEKAVEFGREIAKNSELGQIVIHRKDGVIQTEHTYGHDPRKTKG